MKKTLSMLLALMLVLACINIAVADDEWITLRVEAFDRNIAGFNVEDCFQLHYAQEHFGDPNHIKLEYVSVSRWDETTLMTNYLAGQTAPDLCMTYGGELLSQYIEMGGITPLDDLLNEYGPNLKAFLGDELLTYGQVDPDGDGVKTQYYIPARRLSVANVGNFIRKDWLEALNMESPKTIEELTAFFRAAKDANLGGQQTIPFWIDLYESDPLYNIRRFTDAFIDFSQVTEEDWFANARTHEMLPGSKEGYRWLNTLYHDGLLYENFALDDDATPDSYMVLGYFGCFTMQPDQPWRTDKNYEKELENNVPGASWTTVNPFFNESLGVALHDVYAANGMSIFIPGWVDEKIAAAAIKYMDWLAVPENMFIMQNGTEGINYLAVNEDGIPVQVQAVDTVADEYKMHAGDICFISNGLYYGSAEKNTAAIALSFPGYEEEVEKSYADALSGAWTQLSFVNAIQAETDYGTMVKSKQGEFLTKVVTCDPAEFDAVYDAAVEATLSTGAAEMIEAFRAAYQAGEVRGTFPGNK